MAADNNVEIRFKVVDDTSAVTPSSGRRTYNWRSIDEGPSATLKTPDSAPVEVSQRQREYNRRVEHSEHAGHSQWERIEHRIEHKMRHIGSKLIAAQLVEEGADVLGIGHSFAARLGEHAIEGFMMAGPQGAALKSVQAIVHQLAEIIKTHSEDLKKIRERAVQAEEKAEERWLEVREEMRKEEDRLKQDLEEQKTKEREAFQDYLQGAYRFINIPYLGQG